MVFCLMLGEGDPGPFGGASSLPNGAHNISRERMGLGFLEDFTTYT